MPGVRLDQTKIRISREILSGGSGYRALRHGWSSRAPKTHMGRFVRGVYIPTSSEWEPPGYLMDNWWKIVNEEGNIVGLKALIPLPEKRWLYEHPPKLPWRHRLLSIYLPVSVDWPWTRRQQSKGKLLMRVPTLGERLRGWFARWKLRR